MVEHRNHSSRSTRSWIWLGSDRGVALPMVLMIFLVGVALISAFLVAIVGSSQVTSANKNIVQAQAAAEAGIAAAQVVMLENPCNANLTALEKNTAELTYRFSAPSPTCVTTSEGKRTTTVRAIGTSGNATASVEAVFAWTKNAETAIAESNYLAYIFGNQFNAHNSNSLILNNSSTITPILNLPSVSSQSDGFMCSMVKPTLLNGTNISVIPATLRVGQPFQAGGPCSVSGDLYLGQNLNGSESTRLDVGRALVVSGSGTLPVAGTIGTGQPGDGVRSNGFVKVKSTGLVNGKITSAGGVEVESGGRVNGDIVATGDVKLSSGAIVTGNIWAGGTVSLEGNPVSLAVPVGGCVVHSNNVNWNNAPSGLDISKRKCARDASVDVSSTATTVPPLTFEPWRDFSLNDANKAKLLGLNFTITPVTGKTCSDWRNDGGNKGGAWEDLSSLTSKAVYDLTACTDGTLGPASNVKTITLPTDVMIVTNKLNLSGITFKSNSTEGRMIWLVQPDAVDNSKPDCTVAGNFVDFSQIYVNEPVSMMLYSPCSVKLHQSKFRGGLYVAGVDTQAANSELTFSPTGLPTWGTEVVTPPGGGTSAKGTLGTLIVQRNVQ